MISIDSNYWHMPFRPTHRQLEYLVAVADRGHFGAAAKACNVSQPSLSAQLKLLEDQLGAPLIERGPGRARPTPTGEAVLPLARSVLALLDDIVAMAGSEAEMLGRLVTLGVAPTFGPYFMPAFLPELHRRYPQLEIYIREERPRDLDQALASGALDCILSPGTNADPRLESAPVCSEKIWLGVPADHALAHAGKVTSASLRGEKVLTLGRGHRLYDETSRLCEGTGAEMREDYEGTSLDALRQMVSIGMGLSLFPDLYARSEFQRGRNVMLREIEDWPMRREIRFSWRRESARRRHFVELAALAAQTAANLFEEGSERA